MTKKYSYTYNIYVYVFMYTQAVYCDSSCLYLYTGEHQVLSHLVIFMETIIKAYHIDILFCYMVTVFYFACKI